MAQTDTGTRCTIRLLPRQLRALKRMKRQQGTSINEQVRRAVDLWLREPPPPHPRRPTSLDAAIAALGRTK